MFLQFQSWCIIKQDETQIQIITVLEKSILAGIHLRGGLTFIVQINMLVYCAITFPPSAGAMIFQQSVWTPLCIAQKKSECVHIKSGVPGTLNHLFLTQCNLLESRNLFS